MNNNYKPKQSNIVKLSQYLSKEIKETENKKEENGK